MDRSDDQGDSKDARKALYKASLEGNVNALIQILEEDPLVLERTITSSSDTPLHVASMFGHVEFAREILSRKPELAAEFDSEGFSPLHLASARKNIDMVRELVKAAPEVCLSIDGDGRTPLHLAAMKGSVEIMKELFQGRPEAIDKVLLNGGDTILHLCVKHNRLEALELSLQMFGVNEGSSDNHQVSVNSKDDHGNTILHLAVAKKHIQIIKLLLLSNTAYEVEVNALNQNGLTALDILTQSTVRDLKDMEIAEVLRGAGGLSAMEVSSSSNSLNDGTNAAHVIRVRDNHPRKQITRKASSGGRWGKHLNEYEKWLEKKQNTVMVVASLIASIGFQAALNPPSALTRKPLEEDKRPVKDAFSPNPTIGDSTVDSNDYIVYMHANTIGVLGSMIVMLLVMSGLPLNRRAFIWVLMFMMFASITAMGISYKLAIDSVGPHCQFFYIFSTWRGLIVCILLMHTTRFLLWFVKKIGRSKRIFLWSWCPIALAGLFCY